MREIEYRGWDSHNKRWVYGLLLMDAKGHYRIQYNPMRFSVVVNPDSIGEYTGLKGANGEKIYEGDIVRWNDYTGKVIFERGKFMRKFENVSVPLSSLVAITRVVGNIHDNPELLKFDITT